MWYATLSAPEAHGVSSRVMNYLCFLNSKSLFRFLLSDQTLMSKHTPVSLHVNYHPEKLERMQDAYQRWHGLGPDLGRGPGKPTARAAAGGLHAWHWGVGLKAGKACREAKRDRGMTAGSKLAERLASAGGRLSWGGVKGVEFKPGGGLGTPWGAGSWGTLHNDRETLFADFAGQQHLITPHPDGWPRLRSKRCADAQNVTLNVVTS